MGKDDFMDCFAGNLRGDRDSNSDRDQGGDDDIRVKQETEKLYHGDDDSEGGLIADD